MSYPTEGWLPTWRYHARDVALFLAPAIVLGGVARGIPIVSGDFPLNDGGLFVAMAEDIRAAGFRLPEVTTYNFEDIPFAYPPLALYLLAGLMELGLSPNQLMRWIPLIVSVATVPLMYVLAKELLGSWRLAGAAAIAFALVPRSYEWIITGGGLTRGLGMVFALLTIWQAIRLMKKPSSFRVIITGLLGASTVLIHPEASVFAALSIGLLWLALSRSLGVAIAIGAAGALAVVAAAPWWIAVIQRHGVEVFVRASESRLDQVGESARRLLFGDFTGAASLDIFLGVGFIGLLVQLGRRRYVLPAWILVITFLIAAAGPTFVSVPWSMLIAIAVIEVIIPMASRLAPVHGHARLLMAGGLLGAAVLSTLATGYNPASPVHALSSDTRNAMTWIAENTPRDAEFAVVTGLAWQIDATSEWFPELADRTSLATPQGYEWSGQFSERLLRHGLLQGVCAHSLADCLDEWAEVFGVEIDYVFVPAGQLNGLASPYDCCRAIREDLRRAHETLLDDEGGTVVRLKPDEQP